MGGRFCYFAFFGHYDNHSNSASNVMRWQARNSSGHEETQNNLLRLQIEHEFVTLLNAERETILKLVYELNLVSQGLQRQLSTSDEIHWYKLQNTGYELDERLRILDSRTYSGPYGGWYLQLQQYVKDVLDAVTQDRKVRDEPDLAGPTPSHRTRGLLKAADEKNDPIDIRLSIERAIRMEVEDFKDKWVAALNSST
jgi:hypothetical protein